MNQMILKLDIQKPFFDEDMIDVKHCFQTEFFFFLPKIFKKSNIFFPKNKK